MIGSLGSSAVAQEGAAARSFTVDSGHSSVVFRVLHLNTAFFYGTFDKVSGSLNWDSANPANSSLEVVIDANSVDSNHPKRDEHLRSPDFFNAGEFPEITFKSKSFAKDGEKFSVTGELSFNGTTKEMTVPFEKTGEGKNMQGSAIVGGEAIFTLNRSEFGVKYGPGTLGEEVRVIVSIEAIQK
jgi:polyisoprenoid-binding protein YceI